MKREIIPAERIAQRILQLRGQKVMLSQDLASLYRVTVGALTQAMKRNVDRFPEDFVFQLTPDEFANFTEQGVAMLSSVLKSERAAKVNIAIMRAFVTLRQALETNWELARKFAELEKRVGERTRLACWRWRHRHRELSIRGSTFALAIQLGTFGEGTEKSAGGACAP
jgi:hypothetical protein